MCVRAVGRVSLVLITMLVIVMRQHGQVRLVVAAVRSLWCPYVVPGKYEAPQNSPNCDNDDN